MRSICRDPYRNALEAARRKLELDASLRVAAGTDRCCARCRGTIASERLRALPLAEHCIACQDALDAERALQRRPIVF